MAKDPVSTKNHLIRAFISLISEVGAHQITLQKVAKKAKVPFSSAHYYYGGDWNLIFTDSVLAVGTEAQVFIANYLKNHSTIKSNPIELYIKGTFQWISECRDDSRLWLFNYYFSSLEKKHIHQQNEFIENAKKRVLNLLYEAKGRGFYPNVTVDSEKSDLIYTIVFGLGIMAMIQNFDDKRIKALKTEALRQVNSVLIK